MTAFVRTSYLIEITVGGSDITTASAVEIAVLKPNGIKDIWPATRSSSVVSCTCNNTDMVEPGTYKLQVIATIGGNSIPSDIVKIVAEPRLD